MAFIINQSDVFDFEVLTPLTKKDLPLAPSASGTLDVHYHHKKAGAVQVKSVVLPHMHIMHMAWNTGSENVVLCDSTPADNINVCFVLGGHMHSSFQGITHDLDMQPWRHNLLYIPEAGNTNQIKANQNLSLLHITVQKDYFMATVGQEDAWSEQAITNLERHRPFTGLAAPLMATPYMQQIVQAINTSPETGAMRNLLLQSRVLELLALEIEQFKITGTPEPSVRPDEAEKLYQLKAYLDLNYLTDHSLTQLSRLCLLNEFKLKKGFKLLFGKSVFNYLKELRMEHASLLLRNTATSVDEVAFTLGYEHGHHFSVAFKKHFGVSPSQHLRKKF
ncbi:helix-turn-helix transcriptional regulator [Adhaeribacter swui]|uniref:Helix-turn-helix transcriptional regulator n=1 Tax=Adhaeribacter swui TaxID=2086471 RepID=A0A7G7G4U7_9BACT|nr:AraC family transcriptional regulator [Adhaeribacter swui]QNF32181.1 helix-turn-helix transcriptional regulator [Adhaeribacter swui]